MYKVDGAPGQYILGAILGFPSETLSTQERSARSDALFQVVCADPSLFASEAQGERNQLPPGESTVPVDPLRFLT